MFLYFVKSGWQKRLRQSKIGHLFCFFLRRNCTRLYMKTIVQWTDQMSELAARASSGDRTPQDTVDSPNCTCLLLKKTTTINACMNHLWLNFLIMSCHLVTHLGLDPLHGCEGPACQFQKTGWIRCAVSCRINIDASTTDWHGWSTTIVSTTVYWCC